MADHIIDIHVPGQSLHMDSGEIRDTRLDNDAYGRAYLVETLQGLGATVTVSRGPDAYGPNSASLAEARLEGTGADTAVYLTPREMDPREIGAIRNIAKVIGNGVPELNAPEVRAFARDKVASNILLGMIGVGKAFAPWQVAQKLDEAFSAIPGDNIVLKPRRGQQSKGVQSLTKQELAKAHRNGEIADEQWIIEEKLHFTPPIEIKGINDTEQGKIEDANTLLLPKELRAYTFGRIGGAMAVSYVMRTANPGDTTFGNDTWTFIDPDSVPSVIAIYTDIALRELEQRTGHREMNVAFDWAHVLRGDEKDPRWVAMEINGSEPQIITRAEDPSVARQQTTYLANQLVRVAEAGGTA